MRAVCWNGPPDRVSPSFTRRAALAVAVGGCAAACAHLPSFQTADALPEGETVSGSGVIAVREGEGDDLLFLPQVWFRKGVADHLEIRGAYMALLGLSVGGKYQLLGEPGERGFALSVGADAAVRHSGPAEDRDPAAMTLGLQLPLHLGYRAGPGFAIYATPYYGITHFAAFEDDDLAFQTTRQHAGGSGGLSIDVGSVTLLIEAGALVGLPGRNVFPTLGIGIAR